MASKKDQLMEQMKALEKERMTVLRLEKKSGHASGDKLVEKRALWMVYCWWGQLLGF